MDRLTKKRRTTMTKTAQLKQKPLTEKQHNIVSVIEAYEQSKMMKITLEEFVRTYSGELK
jgi:hypothetical protein